MAVRKGKKGPGDLIPKGKTSRPGPSVDLEAAGTFSRQSGMGGGSLTVSSPLISGKRGSISGSLNVSGGGGYERGNGSGGGYSITPSIGVSLNIGKNKKKKYK